MKEAAGNGGLSATALLIGVVLLTRDGWSIEVAAFVWLLFWLMTAGGYLIHLLARPDHVRFDEGPPDS